jgi:hypothetical protein
VHTKFHGVDLWCTARRTVAPVEVPCAQRHLPSLRETLCALGETLCPAGLIACFATAQRGDGQRAGRLPRVWSALMCAVSGQFDNLQRVGGEPSVRSVLAEFKNCETTKTPRPGLALLSKYPIFTGIVQRPKCTLRMRRAGLDLPARLVRREPTAESCIAWWERRLV